MNVIKAISWISFFIGVVFVAIWSVQEITGVQSDVQIVERYMTGASSFLVLAFILNVISQRNNQK